MSNHQYNNLWLLSSPLSEHKPVPPCRAELACLQHAQQHTAVRIPVTRLCATQYSDYGHWVHHGGTALTQTATAAQCNEDLGMHNKGMLPDAVHTNKLAPALQVVHTDSHAPYAEKLQQMHMLAHHLAAIHATQRHVGTKALASICK